METIILILLSLLSSSLSQRNKDNSFPTHDLTFSEMFSRLMTGNTSDDSIYFRSVPADLYYNKTIPQWPTQEVGQHFNLTGLSNKEMAIVLAFPHITEDKKMTVQSNTNMSGNQTENELISEITNMDNERELTARMLSIPQMSPLSFLNPLNLLRHRTTTTSTTTKAPPVVNNYIIHPKPHPQPFELPVEYKPAQAPYQSAHLQTVQIDGTHGFREPLRNIPMIGNLLNTDMGRVRTPIFTELVPDLQNIELSGHPIINSLTGTEKLSSQQPKPEYPSTDMRPPVLEANYH